MIVSIKNKYAKKISEQALEISELRDALIEIAQIITEGGENNG